MKRLKWVLIGLPLILLLLVPLETEAKGKGRGRGKGRAKKAQKAQKAEQQGQQNNFFPDFEVVLYVWDVLVGLVFLLSLPVIWLSLFWCGPFQQASGATDGG